MKQQKVVRKTFFILLMLAPCLAFAQQDTAKIPIPMKGKIVTYDKTYSTNAAVKKTELFRRAKTWLSTTFTADGQGITSSDKASGQLIGTGIFKVITSESGNYYWLMFKITITVSDGAYTFNATDYYEEPIEKGITNEYSKIEYRWRDFRKGKPWSIEDRTLFRGLDNNTLAFMDSLNKEMNK